MIYKNYKAGFIFVIILSLVLMGVGAKYDYAVTDTLYNPQNPVCIRLESMAKLPIVMFIPVLGACVAVRSKNSVAVFGAGLLAMISFYSLFSYYAMSNMAERAVILRANPYLCGIFGGIMGSIIFLWVRKMGKRDMRRVQSLCYFSFMYLICYVSTGAIKVICGRDRYADIITGGDYAFAPWYKPVFFSSGTSFPSGHTAAAMGILVLLILPVMYPKFKKLKGLLFILCYGFVFAVGFSRLVMGRHFLSDVAFAVLYMTVGFILISSYFEKNYRRLFKNSVSAGKNK